MLTRNDILLVAIATCKRSIAHLSASIEKATHEANTALVSMLESDLFEQEYQLREAESEYVSNKNS